MRLTRTLPSIPSTAMEAWRDRHIGGTPGASSASGP